MFKRLIVLLLAAGSCSSVLAATAPPHPPHPVKAHHAGAVLLKGYNVGPLVAPPKSGPVTFGLVATSTGQVRLAKAHEKATVAAVVDVDGAASVNLCGYVQIIQRPAAAQGQPEQVDARLVGTPYFCQPGSLPPQLN